tara:strand:+ start:41124 stop:41342 length:219 start_codon:yes stop_codon:yes gene_type:complete
MNKKQLEAKIKALKESKKAPGCNKKCQDKIDANIKMLQDAIKKIDSKGSENVSGTSSMNNPVYETPSKGTRT